MTFINSYRFGGAPSFSFGNALQFDGTDDYVSFTQNVGNNTWAYSGWFYSSIVNTTNQGLIGDSNSNKYIRVNNASGRIIVREVGGTQVFFTGFTFANNTWYHVVVSSNNLQCRCWVNNVESSAGTLTIAATTGTINQFENLGRDNSGNYLNGKYDEVGLWYNYALTPTDVTTLYNSGNGNACTDISPANLHLNYHFDESGTATTAVDSSSAGNNGTLNNFPTSGMWVPH